MKFDISNGIEKIKVLELGDQVLDGGYIKPESDTIVDIDRSSFYDSGIISVNFNYNKNTERMEKIL